MGDWLNSPFWFLAGSVAVGISIAIQMLALRQNKGKIASTGITPLLSFLDFLWFFICGATLAFVELTALQKTLPIAFIIYSITAFFYAGTQIEGMPERVEDIEFKPSYISFCLSFSLVFIAWAALLTIHTHTPIDWLNF